MKKDREGVASTVGTIMALLVFLAFMSLITNNYVPAWMMDNERQHMNEVIDEFGQMKSKVDSMILETEIKGTGMIKMYAPLTLGSAGVPLFATPTGSILDYIPQGGNTSGVSLDYRQAGSSAPLIPGQMGGGKVAIEVPNRYYIKQTIAYENGAVIISQDDGQTMRAYPSFTVSKLTGVITVSFTEIDILGTNHSVAGSDSIGFNIEVKYLDQQIFNTPDGVCYLNMTTAYSAAWMEYFNITMTNAGLVSGTDYVLTKTNTADKSIQSVSLRLNNVGTVNYYRALVSMSMLA